MIDARADLRATLTAFAALCFVVAARQAARA
jgi:hypothetical protein